MVPPWSVFALDVRREQKLIALAQLGGGIQTTNQRKGCVNRLMPLAVGELGCVEDDKVSCRRPRDQIELDATLGQRQSRHWKPRLWLWQPPP